MNPARVVSGGQTGVDRGALDAALDAGWPCGGWCPAGRAAEDGPIPARYPLTPTRQSDPAVRTLRNVEDSDGTLVLCPGEPAGGTALTVAACQRLGRPCLVIDAGATTVQRAIEQVRVFALGSRIRVLNVAGPRASGWSGGKEYARAVVAGVLDPVSGRDA